MNFKITHLEARTETWSDRKNEPYKLNNKLYIWPEERSNTCYHG